MKYTYFIVFLMIQNGEKATANTVLALDGCIDSVEDVRNVEKFLITSMGASEVCVTNFRLLKTTKA